MKQLFHLKPWKKDAEGNHFQGYFWLYIWFSMKCGLYLVMFAIGDPIFLFRSQTTDEIYRAKKDGTGRDVSGHLSDNGRRREPRIETAYKAAAMSVAE